MVYGTGYNDDTMDGVWRTAQNEGYNLRPCATHANNRYDLAQDSQHSAEIKMAVLPFSAYKIILLLS